MWKNVTMEFVYIIGYFTLLLTNTTYFNCINYLVVIYTAIKSLYNTIVTIYVQTTTYVM
jgi:hypothetical protein